MYALDNDSGVQTMPEVKTKKFNHTEPRWFTEGGNGVAPSYPGADWFNIVQAELLNVLKDGGIKPEKSQLNQITTAIRQIVTKAVGIELNNKAPLKHQHVIADIIDLQTALDEAGKKGLPVGAIVAFPKEVKNPTGFLKCDGTTIDQRTYPDLYRTLGNKNTLPNLTRSDVGMTAYFATDEIPEGWIAFDEIKEKVKEDTYPELYQYLIEKYTSIDNVPKAEDRFLRNAANELVVGRVQEDAIKTHSLNYGTNHNSSNYQYHVDNNDTIATGNNKTADNYKIRTNGAIFYSGAEETRPKSLILKLCIKAKNTFDDVQFWIKAFGAVENAGMMDASKIAVALQGKSDLGHLHTASQITDFNSAVASQFSYQKIGDVEVRKYPDGTMIQTGIFTHKSEGYTVKNHVVFPIAFVDKNYRCFITEKYEDRASGEGQYNWIFMTADTNTQAIITNWYLGKSEWLVIGRWKEDK